MEKNKLIIALGICSCILIIVLFGIYSSKPLKEETLDIKFQVGDSFGLLTSNDSLDFGKVYPGASVSKTIKIHNNYDFDIKLNFFVNKELNDYISSKPEIILNKSQTIGYPISLQTPEDIEKGNYSGKLKIEFRKIT
ncbi:MAG: hypothetical protein ACOCUU_01055 [Nanoarchaeota archaeon]